MLWRRAATFCVLTLALGGCLGGDGDDRPASAPDAALTIYASLPGRGLSAGEAAAVEAGARLALERAGGRAGAHPVRLVRLDSTKTADEPWDPGQVEANAERASDDPTAIAYIGELDLGASAISVPVTNDAGLLQVSPLDALTSLTQAPPGRAARGAPERYYPTGRRTFLRLTPSDLREADELTARVGILGAQRVALVNGEGVYAVELASQLAQRLRQAGRTLVTTQALRDDPGSTQPLVAELRAARPDAIIYAGLGDRPAQRLLASLGNALPLTPVLASDGVISNGPQRFASAPARVEAFSPLRPAAAYGRWGRRVLRSLRRRSGAAVARPEALYGYEAVRVVLDAVEAGGTRRAAVVRAGLRARLRSSPLGRYEVRSTGDVNGQPMLLYSLHGGRFVPETTGR